jgi:hypothetical protein
MGATLIFQDRVREWHSRYSIAFVIVQVIALESAVSWGGNVLLNMFWSGPAALGLGFLLVMLPRFDAQMQRLVASRKRDEEAIRVFKASGDSELRARARQQVVKTGFVYPLLLRAGATGLASFGLYGAFTGDIWGVALFLMWLPAILLLIWVLRLRKQAGALGDEARPA